MNIERLEMLKDLMLNLHERLPHIKFFDMHTWGTEIHEGTVKSTNDGDDGGEGVLSTKSTPLNTVDCGTAACALGCAGLYKPFIEMGLESLDDGDGNLSIRYETHGSWFAGKYFFDITMNEVKQIFEADCYKGKTITPEMVVARVDEVIAGDVE